MAFDAWFLLTAFADNNQLHVHCDISVMISSVNVLEECIIAIGHWVSAIGWNLTPKKLSWCGLASNTASQIFSATTTWVWHLERTLLRPRTWYGCLVCSSHRISRSRNKLHPSAPSVSFQLRQLRCVRRSLDRDSAATRVRAFVASRIDYGNALLANAPKIWTEKLQLVLNAAARVITGTRKFDSGPSRILHHDLHWLDVPQRVIFKLCKTVYKCLHGLAPKYLAELCVPVADVARRRQLRSASRGLLNFPRFNLSNYGRSTFVLFRRSSRLELTCWAYPTININSCL